MIPEENFRVCAAGSCCTLRFSTKPSSASGYVIQHFRVTNISTAGISARTGSIAIAVDDNARRAGGDACKIRC
jgi:hypothetical protein